MPLIPLAAHYREMLTSGDPAFRDMAREQLRRLAGAAKQNRMLREHTADPDDRLAAAIEAVVGTLSTRAMEAASALVPGMAAGRESVWSCGRRKVAGGAHPAAPVATWCTGWRRLMGPAEVQLAGSCAYRASPPETPINERF